MTEFERIVYLDADILIVNPFRELLEETKPIFLAARSWGGGEFRPSFNMGVFSIKPDKKEFWRLMKLRLTHTDYPLRMAEQAFLNSLYLPEKKWVEIGWCYNSNMAIYCWDRNLWNDLSKQCEPKIIHYTSVKPFDPHYATDREYPTCAGLLDQWHQIRAELEKEQNVKI